ncbi:hypothetical protein [Phyllobacterium sp. P5_D12]
MDPMLTAGETNDLAQSEAEALAGHFHDEQLVVVDGDGLTVLRRDMDALLCRQRFIFIAGDPDPRSDLERRWLMKRKREADSRSRW